MIPGTRKQAIALGLKQYCNGVPCKNGNVANRLVTSSACQCQPCRQEAVDKVKKWRRENPDRSAAHSKAWQERHHDRYLEIQRENYRKQPEAYKAWSLMWNSANPGRKRANDAIYYRNNKDRSLAHSRKRKAAKRRAVPLWFGELDELVQFEAYQLAAMREKVTGKPWHVDHMLPIAGKTVSGLHVWNNLQVIPGRLNLAKHNRLILVTHGEWLNFPAMSGSISETIIEKTTA